MDVARYLERIGFRGPVRPDLDCLKGVHRGHLTAIAYENVDVQLGRRVDQDIERIFEKMVVNARGGWCYEMNGLLGWALGEIGFDVMRMTGGVGRTQRGDDALGNHLVLCVHLDQPYLADVGIGTGIPEATPLLPGSFAQDGREFALEPLGDGLWRFRNSEGAIPADFDFRFDSADEALLAATCEWLQSDPESMFRQNLMCFRLRADGTWMLLGRVLVEPTGHKRLLASVDELIETLAETFGVIDPELGDVWPQVCARHEELFGDTPADAITLDRP
jgi:N-hydroxyarylamine O-acetyltransferase